MIIKLLEIDNLPKKQHKYNPIKKKNISTIQPRKTSLTRCYQLITRQ